MIKTKMVSKRLCVFENFCEDEKIVRKNERNLDRFRLALLKAKCDFTRVVISLSWLFHNNERGNFGDPPHGSPFFLGCNRQDAETPRKH